MSLQGRFSMVVVFVDARSRHFFGIEDLEAGLLAQHRHFRCRIERGAANVLLRNFAERGRG